MNTSTGKANKGSGHREIASRSVVVHSIKSGKTQKPKACPSVCDCATCQPNKRVGKKHTQKKTGKNPRGSLSPRGEPEVPTPSAPVPRDPASGFSERSLSNASISDKKLSTALAGPISSPRPSTTLSNPLPPEECGLSQDLAMHTYALLSRAQEVPPPPKAAPLLTRTTLLTASAPEVPSWDSLPMQVPIKRGARRDRQSKGGRSGKSRDLVQTAEAESLSMENGIVDAQNAKRQEILTMFLDAICTQDSKYVTEETRAAGNALLAKYSVTKPSDVTEDVIESVLLGSQLPAPAVEVEIAPEPPVCTSIMRDPTAVVDPWKFSMTVCPPPRTSAVMNALLHIPRRMFPTLKISPWIMDFFCPRVGTAAYGTVVDTIATISLLKWPVTQLLLKLSSMLTASHVERLADAFSIFGPFGWANVQFIGQGVRIFSALAPVLTGVAAVASTLQLGYEICRGDHTKIVRYTVRSLPADELCLSSACNEHRDVRSLSAGKVERSKCGCFSKVSVRVYKSTFGVLTYADSEHYISDEVFANLSAMNMLRPGLSLQDNIKRLRNTTGLSDYVNLNRGDKSRNLASTFWLAEIKLISEWVEHNSLTRDLLPQLE